MFNYSIIIPYRDKYDLLLVAVNSIPDREDIQIIIVDNSPCAMDSSQVPQKRKASILYTTSDSTKGAGHARNVGLKNVQGIFLLFMDADDYFTESAFSVFDNYLNNNYDIVFFKPTSVKLGSHLPSNRHINYSNPIDRYLISRDENELRYRYEVPWCKLFRTRFVIDGGFQFEELRVNNDAWFSLQTGHCAQSITADNSIVYVLTEGEAGQSLTKTKTSENQLIRYRVAIKTNKFLKDVDKYDMRIRLLGHIKNALFDFGFKEMIKYLRIAYKEKCSIF